MMEKYTEKTGEIAVSIELVDGRVLVTANHPRYDGARFEEYIMLSIDLVKKFARGELDMLTEDDAHELEQEAGADFSEAEKEARD